MFSLKKLFRRKDNIFEGSDMEWLKDIQKQGHDMTPDLWQLQQKSAHLVFVYNECQSGQYENEALANSPLCTLKSDEAYTEDQFVLYKKNLGLETFPIALKPHFNQQHGLYNITSTSLLGRTARVQGEVYAMSAHNIKLLDNYVLNTVQFTRQRVNIHIPFRPNNKLEPLLRRNKLGGVVEETVECFMYIGRYDFFKDQLDGHGKFFSPVTLYQNVNREWCYHFKDKVEINSTRSMSDMYV